jgi:hypothetical protein
MSHTVIYKCDICGKEGVKDVNWRIGTRFPRPRLTRGERNPFMEHGDLCLECCEGIEDAFDEAWDAFVRSRQ